MRPLTILFFLLSMCQLLSCRKMHCFGGDDKEKGIIESAIEFDECIESYPGYINMDWMIGQELHTGVIIDHDSMYQKLLSFQVYEDTGSDSSYIAYIQREMGDCYPTTLPEIDFSKHTLLGLSTMTNKIGGVAFHRKVNDNKKKKTYNYTVTIRQCGVAFNKVGGPHSNNWVLVPKLPEGYTVNFKTKE